MEHLVCAVHDGFTQVLQARLDKDGGFRILHHELLDNRLDFSLARHGHLRPEARELVEKQLRPLALRQQKGPGPVDILLAPSLATHARTRQERESWARQLNSTMGYTVHCLDGDTEGRLLKLAHERCFPGEEHCYLLQPGGWHSLLVRELGQGTVISELPWGCERPGFCSAAGVIREDALPELDDLLRGHLKVLDVTGQHAWLLGLVAARLTFRDDRRLAACTLDHDGVRSLRDWLCTFDAGQRETLPMLGGRGHSIIDALALVEAVMTTRGFRSLRFCPWNAAHAFLLERLQAA